MKANIISSEEFFGENRNNHPPGTIAFVGDGPGGLAITCPGCGSESYLPFKPPRPTWTWDNNREQPTLRPSCLSTCCGWHGYLTAGEWKSC